MFKIGGGYRLTKNNYGNLLNDIAHKGGEGDRVYDFITCLAGNVTRVWILIDLNVFDLSDWYLIRLIEMHLTWLLEAWAAEAGAGGGGVVPPTLFWHEINIVYAGYVHIFTDKILNIISCFRRKKYANFRLAANLLAF